MGFFFELILILEGCFYGWSLGVFDGRMIGVVVVRVFDPVVFFIGGVGAVVSLEGASSA